MDLLGDLLLVLLMSIDVHRTVLVYLEIVGAMVTHIALEARMKWAVVST